MAEPTPRDRAAKGYTLLLQRMPHGTATVLAKEMGLSDKELSEIKKNAEGVLLLLAHVGIKAVPSTFKCLDAAAYEFATQTIQRLAERSPALLWGEEDAE